MIFRSILKRVDYLAPTIGLYYNGSSKHYSKVSHIISLTSVILMALSIIYFIRPFFSRKNPSTVINEELINEEDTLDLNPSNFFHFVHVLNLKDQSSIFFDFTYFRVIGIQEDLYMYKEYQDLKDYDHWVYGSCDLNTHFEAIKDLEDFKDDFLQFLFSESLCIKKYYNKENQQYYDINTNGFKWPSIKGGIINDNKVIYNIIIERCQQDTLDLIIGEGFTCKNDSRIYEKIGESLYAYLSFLDYYIDLDDYHNPEKKYLTEIYDEVQNEFYIKNEITLSHITVETSKGILFNRSKKKKIYDYDDSEKTIIYRKDDNNTIYNSFTFDLSNIRKIYSRKYKNLIDIFSSIGGFAKIIKVIANLIIKYYNEYNILYDTKELISNLYNDDKEEKYKRRKIKLNLSKTSIDNIDNNESFSKLNSGDKNNNNKDNNNNIKEINFNNVNHNNINKINNNINNNNFNNINYNNINKINNNINDNNNINKNLNIDKLISSRNSQNNTELTTNTNNYVNSLQNLKVREDNLRNINQENLDAKNEEKIDKNNDEKSNKKSENSEETSSYFVEKNKQFSYCSFVAHKLTCKKKYQFYKIYDKFRTNILSEEQFIKNHIITYNLSKKENISLERQIYSLKEIIEDK